MDDASATGLRLPAGTFSSLGRLLRQEDPRQMSALAEDYPEIAPWLAEVKVLGAAHQDGRSAGPNEARDRRLAEGLLRVARLGLAAAGERAERLLQSLPRRARLAKRLKLSGSIIATIASAGVVSALALAQEGAALASGCLSFSSSVVALLGEHIESPLLGPRKGLGELLGDVSKLDLEIRDAGITLLEVSNSSNARAAADLARKVNEIAARLRALEVMEGLAPMAQRRGVSV